MLAAAKKKPPSPAKSSGKVRLIAGQWRGRLLPVIAAEDLRPTGDRVRETLFNWLQFEWEGARWLDLFSGSGALAFEALSRYADQVVMLERHPQAVRQLQQNKSLLEANGAEIIQADTFSWLQDCPRQFDVFDGVFCDPPFSDERVEALINQLVMSGLLKPNGWLYLEQPKQRVLSLPHFECYRQQTTGAVSFGLWRLNAEKPSE
ncbi:MAG: 16S rRNA (guanine(966)-N(2))-methyltransferase RsmD [Gammaproteobacteria bacterium]|nr:16S rRNA (guanine(966)-N(2))-methyltransferase RsmD [Gammaproteobacteria bacterium]